MSAVIEEFFSESRQWKAQICRRQDGFLTVELLRWRVDELEGHLLFEGWLPGGRHSGKILDSLDDARAIARELVRNCD